MERERDRVEGARDALGTGADGLDGGGERHASCALAVQPHGQAARLLDALDELARLGRVQRAGRVVDQDARRAELGEAVRALEQHLRLTRRPGAVHEADRELLARVADRVRSLAQVRQVVDRVVDAEDVDAAARRGRHEAADEIPRDGTPAHEEPAAKRHAERRLAARADGADALPRALHPAPHGAVEAAAAGDLQAREAGLVQLARELVETRGRDAVRERLLREEPDRRVDELRHGLSYAREM